MSTKNNVTDKVENFDYDKNVYSHEENVYGYYYDDELKERVFGVVGKVNVYDDIQSHANETDMKFIKEKLLEHGSDIIDEKLMIDCSIVSNDLLTNMCKVDNAKSLFKQLPMQVREKYGNDMYRFARDFNIDDFIENKEVKQGEVKNEN